MELLSPAGDKEALIAAVRNGADAVYLGAQALNARKGAGNFDADGLVFAADYCHERGRRLYATVNTVVKESEMALLEDVARQLYRAGADGAIIQDLGVGEALGRMLPGLELHASTQMALANRQGARFLRQHGYRRMVLAREASLCEIRQCADEGIDIEVFGHGALCVACSGQCLFSSMVGGRSGNRGMCAQPCRLPYRLEGESGYLLSPKDLMTLTHLKELEQAGAMSLKLEGRLKRPEYVAIVTRIYRAALDGRDEKDAVESLKQIFNRGGFTQGYAFGLDDAELMSRERPNHMGVAVGKSLALGKITLEKDVSPADQLTLRDEPVRLSGARGQVVSCARAAKGDPLMRLADDTQLRQARQSYADPEPPCVSVAGTCVFAVGENASLTVSDGERTVSVEGPVVQQAQKPMNRDAILTSLGKTGGTPYAFSSLTPTFSGEGFLPVSALNALRRDALEKLSLARRECLTRRAGFTPLTQKPRGDIRPARETPRLCVQSSDLALLKEAPDWGADEIAFAPTDLTRLPELRGIRCALALPPVCPGDDLDTLHAWARQNAESLTGVIASNPAHLALGWPCPVRADYMLNAANALAVDFLAACGASVYSPSLELTAREIDALPGEKELVVYGRVPLMQLRHCPLRASAGGGLHDACRRCDSAPRTIDEMSLIDRKNVAFPLRRVKTSAGCIVRVMNSVPLMLLRKHIPDASAWRVMLDDESPETARAVVEAHRAALDGAPVPDAFPFPTTTGHYYRPVE